MLLALFPAAIHAATTDAARVAGDLKVDGIHFSTDGSVQTKANPWGNGDPDAAGSIGFMQGNVGIGILTPTEQLELTGNLKLPATSAKTGQIRQGGTTLMHTFGVNNFFAGSNAGNLTMSGSHNTAVGSNTLLANTTGRNNTAIGRAALTYNISGYHNTASGDSALFSNTTGYDNNANGAYALYYNTIGEGNKANGYTALYSNTTGYDNTATGSYALYDNTTG